MRSRKAPVVLEVAPARFGTAERAIFSGNSFYSAHYFSLVVGYFRAPYSSNREKFSASDKSDTVCDGHSVDPRSHIVHLPISRRVTSDPTRWPLFLACCPFPRPPRVTKAYDSRGNALQDETPASGDESPLEAPGWEKLKDLALESRCAVRDTRSALNRADCTVTFWGLSDNFAHIEGKLKCRHGSNLWS